MKNDNENIISLTSNVEQSIISSFSGDVYDDCEGNLEVMVVAFGLAICLLVRSIMLITLWYHSLV